MPLRDHFHPPLFHQFPWQSLHASWTTRIADNLNECWLPSDFIAAEYAPANRGLEIDVATHEQSSAQPQPSGNGATTTLPQVWAPPAAPHTVPAAFSESFEVRVFNTMSGMTLVGAIELISPSNKDRPEERRAFAAKCAGYMAQGVSVVIIDIVTSRLANLHNHMMELLPDKAGWQFPEGVSLYATAYRPVRRDEREEIDIWTNPLTMGESLPTMPLRLTRDWFVPVEFEETYEEACRRRRIT